MYTPHVNKGRCGFIARRKSTPRGELVVVRMEEDEGDEIGHELGWNELPRRARLFPLCNKIFRNQPFASCRVL
jgi:hypothetical protein